MRRLAALTLALAALATFAALAGPAGALAAEPQTSLPEIETEVMCPVCGVPLELATEAPQALRERAYIRELIDRGLTKDEIKDRLVDQYGDRVLALPDGEGLALGAWLVPGAAILTAAGTILVGLRRWRRAGAAASDGSAEPAQALDDEERKRLDADLARYEL